MKHNENILQEKLTDLCCDKKHSLIAHARGLKSMFKWLDDGVLAEDGVKCIPCSTVITYNYPSEGREFGDVDKLPIFQKHEN